MTVKRIGERFVLLGILVAALLAVTPCATMAGGGGMEISGGCLDEPDLGIFYTFDGGPVWTGAVTLEYTAAGGLVHSTAGVLTQGSGTCTLDFGLGGSILIWQGVDHDDFKNLRPSDLRGLRINPHFVANPRFCTEACLEVVGAGGLLYNDDRTVLTARFVVMKLKLE
jgi:hypothetical protein